MSKMIDCAVAIDPLNLFVCSIDGGRLERIDEGKRRRRYKNPDVRCVESFARRAVAEMGNLVEVARVCNGDRKEESDMQVSCRSMNMREEELYCRVCYRGSCGRTDDKVERIGAKASLLSEKQAVRSLMGEAFALLASASVWGPLEGRVNDSPYAIRDLFVPSRRRAGMPEWTFRS
nr:hypothetical protein CFP56_41399 [Quercus suber]